MKNLSSSTRKISLRMFPTHEGDTSVDVPLRELDPDKLFVKGKTVVMDGKLFTDWDSLLLAIEEKKDTEPVEIMQMKAVVGG